MVEEFLKPKMYLFLVDNSEHKEAKCVNKNAVATINHNEYKDVLLNNSSIVNEAIRTISNLFIFFLRKDFKPTKTCHKQKPTNKTRQQFFVCTKSSKRVKIICFVF